MNCDNVTSDYSEPECADVICTMEFRSVTIQVKYKSNNNPVVLRSYNVVRTSDSKDITSADNDLTDNNGYYTIINDNTKDLKKNIHTEVEFLGYMNNTMVVRRRFIVTADCCHVSLISGDTVAFI